MLDRENNHLGGACRTHYDTGLNSGENNPALGVWNFRAGGLAILVISFNSVLLSFLTPGFLVGLCESQPMLAALVPPLRPHAQRGQI